MQKGNDNLGASSSITVFCDGRNAFNRNLLALVRHWDKDGHINIQPAASSTPQPSPITPSETASTLLAIDENGVNWSGAEAVPIIFKNLPYGKLAAAMYTLPGTMWLTRRFYGQVPHR